MRRALRTAILVAIACLPASAFAQTPRVELGASLANAIIGIDDDDTGTVFGVPSGGFGLMNPGVYGSFFVLPRLALEPQIGLVVASFGGETSHLVNVAGQVNYFFSDTSRAAMYVLGSAGVFDASGGGTNPKTVSAGVGYRMPVGQNLSFRLDGRYARFIIDDDGSNTLAFTFSIGGILGTR
jgi:hypothetical protein